MSSNSLPRLHIHLLGAPQITCNGSGGAQHLPTKAQALLYYLALTGRPHTRAALAGLLWSEHGEEEARRNLRKVIQVLREQLAPYLAIDTHTVALGAPAMYWVDAAEFAAAAPPGSPHTQIDSCDRLQAALALYRADFLDGFHVRDAPAFETWMLAERTRLRELLLERLSALAFAHAAHGDLPAAIATVRRLLELEPWREEAHRQLMEWLAQTGQRNSALLQYDLCCRILAEELGVEPDAATRALHTRLLLPDAPAAAAQPQQVSGAPVVVDYPLIGRREPWQTLRAAWSRALQSGLHVVYIGGEAGIGKTRLAEELLLHVQRQGHAAARARAYALEGRLAYAPLADLLRTPPLQARLAKLDHIWSSEIARLVPELLVQYPDLPVPAPLTERWQQKRLFDALCHAFTAESHPLLLVLDDLQWCDPETLAFLQYLVEAAPKAPVLVVGTVRSDELNADHPLHKLRRALQGAGKLTTINLTPLDAEETSTLGAEVVEYALDGVGAAGLYRASAGNPLFIIEALRAGSQAPQADLGAVLPPRVHAVIEFRLAQLSAAAHSLAQLAAVIGRAFTLPLLMAAGSVDEEAAVAVLDELWQRRIIYEQAGGRYDFTHDRIRDVAYAEIGPIKRGHLHRRLAQALERLYENDLDIVVGELGLHYARAGAWEEALGYYRRAAGAASRLYAHSEEVEYLQKAITAAQMLPSSAAAAVAEAQLWHDLGLAQVYVHGWGSELAAAAWRRADALAAMQGDVRQRCDVLARLSTVAQNQGDWHRARELDELAVTLAQQTGDAVLIDTLSASSGRTLCNVGHFAEALAAFRRDPAFAPTPDGLAEAWAQGDLSSSGLLRMAKCLWLLGYPDQAFACASAMVARRQLRSDLVGRCAGRTFVTMLYSFAHDVAAVRQLSEELIAVSMQYDFPFFAREGRVLQGWAMAHQGALEDGLALLRYNLDDQLRSGVHMFEPYYRCLLAEVLALSGAWEEALDEVMAAFAYAEQSGNRYWNAQLLKLQGDFQQALCLPPTAVEQSYRRAIAVAEAQGAKMLELRAATALAALWQRQDRPAEAYQLLLPIYAWFTEGFETLDFLAARALLDTLENE